MVCDLGGGWNSEDPEQVGGWNTTVNDYCHSTSGRLVGNLVVPTRLDG